MSLEAWAASGEGQEYAVAFELTLEVVGSTSRVLNRDTHHLICFRKLFLQNMVQVQAGWKPVGRLA